VKTATELDERWERNFLASQRRLILKEHAVAFLGGECKGCGYDKSVVALEFHHRDPRQKDFEISSKMSFTAIEPELRKCILLCSNCHAETHAGLHPQFYDAPRLEDDADEFELFAAFV
jgi:5-methylcytosine-specific restriction endonuclease McrA